MDFDELVEIRSVFGDEDFVPKEAADIMAAQIVEQARMHPSGSRIFLKCPAPDNDAPGGILRFDVSTGGRNVRISCKLSGAKHQLYNLHGRATCTIRGGEGDVSRVAAALRRASADPIEHSRSIYTRSERDARRRERERLEREGGADENGPF